MANIFELLNSPEKWPAMIEEMAHVMDAPDFPGQEELIGMLDAQGLQGQEMVGQMQQGGLESQASARRNAAALAAAGLPAEGPGGMGVPGQPGHGGPGTFHTPPFVPPMGGPDLSGLMKGIGGLAEEERPAQPAQPGRPAQFGSKIRVENTQMVPDVERKKNELLAALLGIGGVGGK